MKHFVKLQALRVLATLALVASTALVLEAGHRW
jgi:hypothetical protein